MPWLYYSFYCRLRPKITYLALIFVLGTLCIVVSMWDRFAQPKFRPLRAGPVSLYVVIYWLLLHVFTPWVVCTSSFTDCQHVMSGDDRCLVLSTSFLYMCSPHGWYVRLPSLTTNMLCPVMTGVLSYLQASFTCVHPMGGMYVFLH